MPEPIRITSLRDLAAAVATATNAPPSSLKSEVFSFFTGCESPEWPPRYSTDSSASFALETKMREEHEWYVQDLRVSWRVKLTKANGITAGRAVHSSRFVAMELASLAALGVELELVEGWDKCN